MRCDRESYYYAFENHWKSNGKSKGAYHGGQWNRKGSRDAMKDPQKYYGSIGDLLLQFQQDAVTEADISVLLNNIVDRLTKCHEVFHTLKSKERKPGSYCHLAFALGLLLRCTGPLAYLSQPKSI